MRFSNTITAITALAFALVGSVLADPGVSPAVVAKDLDPGASFNINKVVTTPQILPKPDVVLLIDVTGSMSGSIANIKMNMINVIADVSKVQPNAQFALASFGDYADSNRFKVNQGLTNDPVALQTAVNSLKAEMGGDEDEDWINALYQLSTGSITFRTDSSPIIVLISDAASHEPSNGHSLDGDTIPALKKVGARVIGVNVGVGQIDKHKQASKVASATGGSIIDSAVDAVTKTIVSGLKNLDVTVKAEILSCDKGLTISFNPAVTEVSSGNAVIFKETVEVAKDAPQKTTLQCFVHFLLNNTPGGNNFVQRVVVPIHQMTCFTCNPAPGMNLCHVTTSCAPTPFGKMCLTRPGYKADGADDNNNRVQWRMKWPVPGQEHRVAVAPGTSANTLCDPKNSGPDVCKEVKVADCEATTALSEDWYFDDTAKQVPNQQVPNQQLPDQYIMGELEL